MNEYLPLRLAGRCLNGAERDGGRRYHAVERLDNGHANKAVCGATYGRTSAGWSAHPGETVSCPRCRRWLDRNRAWGLIVTKIPLRQRQEAEL